MGRGRDGLHRHGHDADGPVALDVLALGATGIDVTQVENASASGCTAFRQACVEVKARLADVAIAVGVDKPLQMSLPQPAAGLHDLAEGQMMPVTHFALLAERYMYEHGATPGQLGMVAVRNSRNGARNPNAQRRKARTLPEALAPPRISGTLTRLQRCPIGEGAAAAIVASGDAEAIGLSPPGQPPADLDAGHLDIGGRVAVNASGGLLSTGTSDRGPPE